MTPEVAEALAARLTRACSACKATIVGSLDEEGRCAECVADGVTVGRCVQCGEVEQLIDDAETCLACSHCAECGDDLDGSDGPYCSDTCERYSRAAHRADLQELDR